MCDDDDNERCETGFSQTKFIIIHRERWRERASDTERGEREEQYLNKISNEQIRVLYTIGHLFMLFNEHLPN